MVPTYGNGYMTKPGNGLLMSETAETIEMVDIAITRRAHNPIKI
jgi:hypothetical protein